VAAQVNPTARRWELATQLRALREKAGRSIEEVANELMCSTAKISRMETAGRGVQPRDVRDLCRYYGVPDTIREQLTEMATEARVAGWWQRFKTIEELRATYIGLETAAESVLDFDNVIIPGLLQNPDYTRKLLTQFRSDDRSDEWVEELAQTREERQKRVQSGELVLHAVIDEAALRRHVGKGPELMRAQIKRLIDDAALVNVTIQVIPFAHGPNAGLEGPFQLLTFPQGRIPPVVFLENWSKFLFVEKPDEVSSYRGVFTNLSEDIALDPDATVVWLKRLLRESRR
jgi:transcriptional regulator with XRE-family HTH domain